MSLADVEAFLNDLVLDASKAALRCPHLGDMHESDAEIYLFLYAYFKRAAIRQKREDSVSITPEAAKETLELILATALAAATAKGKASSSSAAVTKNPAVPAYTTTEDAPAVQQRTLREQLSRLHSPVNLTAFSDVIELCRFVDQQLQHHKRAASFGDVNLLHFCAIFVTLVPQRRLFDIIALVWSTTALPEVARLRIFYVWSVIDAQNRAALRELCDVLTERPGLNLPMLLEFFPQVEHIHTMQYKPLRNSTTGDAATSVAPRTAVHSENDDVAALLAPRPHQTAVAPVHHRHLADDEDEDGEEDDGRTEEDRAFWADLVS